MALKIFVFALLSLLLPACNAVTGSLYPLFLITMKAHYPWLCRLHAAPTNTRTINFCSYNKPVASSHCAGKFSGPISCILY